MIQTFYATHTHILDPARLLQCGFVFVCFCFIFMPLISRPRISFYANAADFLMTVFACFFGIAFARPLGSYACLRPTSISTISLPNKLAPSMFAYYILLLLLLLLRLLILRLS